MDKQRDWTTLLMLGGLALAVATGAWAALGASSVEDLRERVRAQRKRLDEADRLRVELIKLRQQTRAPDSGGGNDIAFLTQMAGSAKLKGIGTLPAIQREGWTEKGYSIELADVSRESLVRFLANVESSRPALRTREIHIRKFTPEGEIAAASAQIVFFEKKAP